MYYDRERVDRCVAILTTIAIGFMLIGPISLEYFMVIKSHGLMGNRPNAIYIGILLVFTLTFSAFMSCFTKARRHEILGAAAA